MKYLFRTIFVFVMVFSMLGSMVCPANAVFRLPEVEEEESEIEVAKGADVPLYFQDDYPDTPFGGGTVASGGCGITCLAMVASYLTDTEYLPDELAERYNDVADNNMARMEYASEDLELPLQSKIYRGDFDLLIEALENGQIAIILLNGDSIFTDAGHFIVLTGISEEGRIFVNDPNKSIYNYNYMMYGFAYGFDQKDIYQCFSGAWIFEKKAEEAEDISSDDFWAAYELESSISS